MILRRPRRTPLPIVFGTVLALLVSVAAPTVPAATAAPVLATYSLKRTATGTGHGTNTACVINSANGYTPGDNSADDEYVCVKDTFTYEFNMNAKTGDGPIEPLEVFFRANPGTSSETFKPDFCQGDGINYTGELIQSAEHLGAGGIYIYGCRFTVKPNVSISLKKNLVGSAPSGTNRPVVLAGGAPTMAPRPVLATGEPYTVIEIARNDIALGSAFADSGVTSFIEIGGAVYARRPMGIAAPLIPINGFSDTKGYGWLASGSTQQPATALDLSTLPPGSFAAEDDRALTTRLQSGSTFTVSQSSANEYRTSTSIYLFIPMSQLSPQATGFARKFQIRIAQNAPTLKTAAGALNWGTGSQPGQTEACTVASTIPGVRTLTNYANNDCIDVDFAWQPTEEIFSKRLDTPHWSGTFLIGDYFSPQEKFTAVFSAKNQPITEHLHLCDAFDGRYQRLRTDAAPTVTVGTTALPTSGYTTYYRTSPLGTTDPCGADPASTSGWSTDPAVLTAAPESIHAAKIVSTQPISYLNGVTARLPMTTMPLSAYPMNGMPYLRGRILDDSLRGSTKGTAWSRPTTATFTLLTGYYENRSGDTSNLTAYANERAGTSHWISGSYVGTPEYKVPAARQVVTIEYGKCLVNPELEVPGGWSFPLGSFDRTVTPPVLGPSGLVCADDQVKGPVVTLVAKTTGDYVTGLGGYLIPKATVSRMAMPGTTTTIRTTMTLQDVPATQINSPQVYTDTIVVKASNEVYAEVGVSATKTDADSAFTYTDMWVNSSSQDLGRSEWISVLPWSGDALGSSFSGTAPATSIAPIGDGVTLRYTKRPGPQLNDDVLDVSNGPGGTIWCTGLTGGECPGSLAEVTGVRALADPLKAGVRGGIRITLSPAGNKIGDIYRHRLGTGNVTGLARPVPISPVVSTTIAASSVSGRVWLDSDGDGRISAAETFVNGATLDLLDSTGAVAATSTTSATGTYVFDRLRPGTYRVRLVRSAPIAADARVTASWKNQVPPAAGWESTPMTLALGDTQAGVDFGLYNERPALSVIKKINGHVAPDAPGLAVSPSANMVLSFEVRNSGNRPLRNLVVTDDTVPGGAVSCSRTDLAVGETITCDATLPAPGKGAQHHNTATAEAISVLLGGADGERVRATASAWAHVPSLAVVKTINQMRAPRSPGIATSAATVVVGARVTNTGVAPLTQLTVIDDLSDGTTVELACPQRTLPVGESVDCAVEVATPAPGQEVNDTVTATAEGSTVPGAHTMRATARDHANVWRPTITLEKLIAGKRADAAPGMAVAPGSTTVVTYRVRNPSPGALDTVLIKDGVLSNLPLGGISCPTRSLKAWAAMDCTAQVLAPAAGTTWGGIATAVGQSGANPDGSFAVAAAESAGYLSVPQLSLAKLVNDTSARSPRGLSVKPQSVVHLTYKVTNSSSMPVRSLAVVDDSGVGVKCPHDTIAPSATVTCRAEPFKAALGTVHTGTAIARAEAGTPDLATVRLEARDIAYVISADDPVPPTSAPSTPTPTTPVAPVLATPGGPDAPPTGQLESPTPAPRGPVAAGMPGLPATGGPAMPLLALAGALTGLGIMLVRHARRAR